MSSALREINPNARLAMRSYIQRVATGPEYSKDISFEEARDAMRHILEGSVDPVQAAVFLIALRMKRETLDENGGCLQAIIDASNIVTAQVEQVIDVADPYDGYTRGLPVSPFIPAVLAACGLAAVSHGTEEVGPKYGATHRKVLRAAGIDVDLNVQQAVERVNRAEIGWAYLDQKTICPALYHLVPLRTKIVKRPVLTTIEVLVGPIRGSRRTTLMTGYVHKLYPPVYEHLAKLSGFDSAVLVRGVEGGVIPPLNQKSKYFEYSGENQETAMLSEIKTHPEQIHIEQNVRAVPLPALNAASVAGDETAAKVDTDQLATEAAKVGVAALQGKPGPAYDSLIYSVAIMLAHLGIERDLRAAAEKVRAVIAAGKALRHFHKNQAQRT